MSKKTLETLVFDIYSLFGSGKEPSKENIDELGKVIAYHVAEAFKKYDPAGRKGMLRASRIGSHCDRKQWYDTNTPEDAEDLEPHVRFKFLYGNILEEIVLFLAEEAGHTVAKRQAEVEVDGVLGHIDGIIDGTLIDVKSANSRGMHKFYNNGLRSDDPFGYIPQIEFYHEGLQNDEALQDKTRYGFLAVDKETGRLHLDVYQAPEGAGSKTRKRIDRAKTVVSGSEPPIRGHMPIPDGSSGNLSLSLPCRYCAHKHECWKDANNGVGLRVFKYSNSLKYLTRVVKTPLVEEVTNKEPDADEEIL